jgi:hypothetical protein
MKTLLYQILITLTLFSFVTVGSYARDEEGNGQEKEKRKSEISQQRSFHGEWEEERAKTIVKDICQEWSVSEGGFSIRESLPFQEAGVSKRLVQVTVQGESCHFCPGTVLGVLFSNGEDTWKIEFAGRILIAGSGGVAPSGELVKIGLKSWGFLFQWSRTAQGGGAAGYVALSAYIGGTFRNVLFVETGYFDDFEETEQDIKFIPGADTDFFDIGIGSKVYRFVEGEYKFQREQ